MEQTDPPAKVASDDQLGPLAQMERLLAFCDWERKHRPHPDGKPHIAEWAAAEIERLHAGETWVLVAGRLPAAGRKVLVCYRNSYGRLRRTCAHYSPLHTVDASTWDEGVPDETEDGAFEPEGWWEEPVEMERVEFIADEVTHWMPLPEPPPLPLAGPSSMI